MAAARKRKVGSVKNELVKKSREAELSAVQIFNRSNSNILNLTDKTIISG